MARVAGRGDPSFVLMGDGIPAEGIAGASLRELSRQGDRLVGPGFEAEVIAARSLASPLLAVEPRPWKSDPRVVSAVALFRDPGDYARAVGAAVALGHERLRGARLEEGSLVLMVEEPSWFLMETWHEEAVARVLWRPEGPPLYLPWGAEHPLRARLRGLETGDRVWLLPDSQGFVAVPSREFTDLVPSLQLDLPRVVDRCWQARGEPPPVRIALRWGHRATPEEPSLWLLPDPGAPEVEALVERLAERDLRSLQLAMVAHGDSYRFLVRRLATGGGVREAPPEIPGLAFAAYAGYGNLFLPRDRMLEPPVRKDRLRSLFGLVPGELVLLYPGAPAPGSRQVPPPGVESGPKSREGMLLMRVPERAFHPLPAIVDYQVEAHREEVEVLIRSAVFDFGPLEFAPVREPSRVKDKEARGADPVPRDPDRGGRSQDEEEAEPTPVETRPVATEVLSPTPVKVADPVPREDVGDDARGMELARRTTEEDGPGPWRELARHERARGRIRESVFALEEAMWRSRGEEEARDREELAQVLRSMLGPAIAEDPGRLTGLAGAGRGDPERSGAAAWLLAHDAASRVAKDGTARVLPEVTAVLREAPLRRKVRWLAWAPVLALSRDETEEERQREEILGSLSRRGLDADDRPWFLGRLLRERAGLEEWSRAGDLPELLDLLAEAAGSVPPGNFRQEAEAMVGRTRLEAEREGRERELLEALEARLGDPEELDPSVASHLAAATCQVDAARGTTRFRSVLRRLRDSGELSGQDRIFGNVFDDLLAAERTTGIRPLLTLAMEVLAELPPSRRARTLAEVAPSLAGLGLEREALELALGMVGDPEVRDDLYLVERVAVAAKELSGRESLPRSFWEEVAGALDRSGERFDALYLDLLEEAVSVLGQGLVERLETRVLEDPGTGSYGGLVLGACRLRLLAETGRQAEGLAQVEAGIAGCWSLPDMAERTRSLSRYVRALAHLGNPVRGAQVLETVVEAAQRRRGKDLDEFFHAEILGEVARTAGRLGDPERAVKLLEAIMAGVEARLSGGREEASLLFEVLSGGIEVLLELGEFRAGLPLVGRIEDAVRARLAAERGVHRGPLFFLHRSRVVCARALLFMGYDERGTEALTGALRGFQQVTALDRPDLLHEAARVLPQIEVGRRREAVAAMVELMRKTDDYGEYHRRCLAEVVASLAAAIRPGSDAYRRELSRWDALEARAIRTRVSREHPSRGR